MYEVTENIYYRKGYRDGVFYTQDILLEIRRYIADSKNINAILWIDEALKDIDEFLQHYEVGDQG